MHTFVIWFFGVLCASGWAQGAANDQGYLAEVEGYTAVSPSDLEFTHQVFPSFPSRALREGFTHEECVAQLLVDEDGKVEQVRVALGCPEVFHKSVTKAAKKWRIEPYINEDGVSVPITFALRFRFQRDD